MKSGTDFLKSEVPSTSMQTKERQRVVALDTATRGGIKTDGVKLRGHVFDTELHRRDGIVAAKDD